MAKLRQIRLMAMLSVCGGAIGLWGCREHMPHAFTWPASGDVQFTHPKPPEGGYYSNWDPYSVSLEVTPMEDVNPVRTQHILIATVKDKEGKPLQNRRIEWIISEGSVGDIVEVDESGWRNSRGYKVDNHFAVSHTGNFNHVMDRGNNDPSDDINIGPGQTWCVITSPIEGTTYITAYAPGIYDWDKHKVFVTKHWFDVEWQFPPPATNPIGTTHQFSTLVAKHSDGTPLEGYIVTYRILDGPGAVFEQSGSDTAQVLTDASGMATVTIRQTQPVEGTNNVQIDIDRSADKQCCKPGAHIATGGTSKTWIGPKIAIAKSAPATALVNEQFQYQITVSNPSQVNATNVVVTDTLPDGIVYDSSSPPSSGGGQSLSWSLGTLPPQGRQTITVQVHGTRSGRFENCAEVSADYGLHDRACAPTVIVSPQLALEKRCPATVTLCDPIEYVIVVRNTGDGPAANVQVNDQLPGGLTTTDGKTSVVSNIGTLGGGEAREIRFVAKASQTGHYENTAMATADNGLTAQASCTTVVTQPVLQVTKTGPDVRYIGRPATYEITVSNTGDSAANNTVLVDTIPTGTTYDSASDGGQFSNGRVTWNLGTIEPGGSRSVSLTVKATQIGSARNTAVATAVCAENSAATDMEIKGVPAILLEVIDVADPIEVGSNETYEIRVTNQGSAADTNIVVECTVPAEMDFVSADGPTRNEGQGRTVQFAPLPSLAPKAIVVYKVVTKGLEPVDARFKVTITSDQTTSPVEETESTHIY